MGVLLEGRTIASEINQRTAHQIAELKATLAAAPTMALLTTEEGGLLKQAQIALHEKAARDLGIAVRTRVLDGEATEADLIAEIEALNRDPGVHGIFVLLPLSLRIRQDVVFAAIDPDKEMEGVSPGRELEGVDGPVDLEDETRKVSSTLTAIRLLLEQIGFDPMRSRNALLAGDQIRDNLVVARLLQIAASANVQVAVAWANDPKSCAITRQADLVLVSISTPELVTDAYVRPGAVVIDFAPVFVGERFSEKQGKLVPVLKNGVQLDTALARAGHIAPAIGGVGPVMMAAMMRNLGVNCRNQMLGAGGLAAQPVLA